MFRYRYAGFIICAFGIGLLLGCCFPEKLIILAVSALLVCAGFFVSRC